MKKTKVEGTRFAADSDDTSHLSYMGVSCYEDIRHGDACLFLIMELNGSQSFLWYKKSCLVMKQLIIRSLVSLQTSL